MKKNIHASSGFTLVELSVSFIIVALLLAAALGGTNLLKSAKLRSIIAEVDKYKMAINSFRARYDELPGDFSKAANYWTTYNSGSNPEGTLSGDADGQIEYLNGSSAYEGFRAWQHLSYAGMIDEVYDGDASNAAAAVVGINNDVPESGFSGAGYLIDYDVMNLDNQNTIVLGVPLVTASTPILANGVILPDDAQHLDKKVDDGIPTTGNVRGGSNTADPPSAGNCLSGSLYALGGTASDCVMGFAIPDD